MSDSVRFDRYEVLGRLGAGGMGEVLRARAVGPHGFEKVVAIKKIGSRVRDARGTDLFIREAQIAAQLQHANIVQVFDFGRYDDELFIVMELVEGCSLASVLEPRLMRQEGFSLEQSLTVIAQVARALDYAHGLEDAEGRAVGVVHRDVSPANILVSSKGVVKLTDFGIAAWAHPERTSLVAGKPAYMAPEQLRGDPLDGRADIFACGVIAYEMITGRRPWSGMVDASRGATLEAIGYRPPSEHASDVPAELDALVEKMLVLDRESRLADAEELEQSVLDVSYACQLKIGPRALRSLVDERHSVEHAPTLDASTPQATLRADHAAAGITVLRSADAAPVDRRTVEPQEKRSKAWMALLLIPVVAVAVWAWPREPQAEPVVSQAEPETESEPEPIDPAPDLVAEAPETETELVPTEMVADPSPMTAGMGMMAMTSMMRGMVAMTEPEETMSTQVAGFGTLNVFSQPWAEIWIDGSKHERNAPTRGIRLSAGRHSLRLINPVSGLSAERTVNVPVDGNANVRVFLASE